MDGVLVIDKPSGPTSHDVVARVRRALKEKRIGHTGTLDPLATGVLPLVIGRATRLASFLSSGLKSYEAHVRLGAATASYDASERIAAGEPPPPVPDVTAALLEQQLGAFRGTYQQSPPPYSAKKIGGISAHRLARRNTPAQPAAVTVTVSDLKLLGFEEGIARIRVTATAGFYVRSLAHDLGASLGCGGHLEALRRTRAGTFTLKDAVALEIVEAEGVSSAQRLVALSDLLQDLPAVRLNERGERRVSHGNTVTHADVAEMGSDRGLTPTGSGSDHGLTPTSPTSHVRLLGVSGALVAIAQPGPGGSLRPTIVLV